MLPLGIGFILSRPDLPSAICTLGIEEGFDATMDNPMCELFELLGHAGTDGCLGCGYRELNHLVVVCPKY